ncbi:tripartite motif-containing protein 16-like protein isoform X2 [Polypterus senegalus]|uniref:tripartite motif-containing protein 16-like protein isoform X2 n=1 Tax=Polypterus senegalus TaxID=55291 RepID=UPI00196385B8|nr:tripartite motif-containing protein 16-like protein isoform X2 [Polypterus senegalus]
MVEAQLCDLQDEFICLLCVETLTDPVSIPCGHSFCLKCLKDCWDQSQECCCPQCKENFATRPVLRKNTVLNEVVKKLKTATSSPSPPALSQNYASPGDVKCDACTGKKFRAVKTCLTCMASYCQTHLQPHFEIAAWKDHKLTDPDGNLKEKFCAKHQKCLEIYCKTEETCICLMCGMTEHNHHEMVALEAEREEKKNQMDETMNEIDRRLEDREKKLKELRRAMEQMKTFSSLCVLPADGDSLRFTATADFSSEELRKELSCLIKGLEKISQWEIRTWTPSGCETQNFTLWPLEPQSREEFLRYFCPLTLDINTAHRRLCLTEGNKKVTHEVSVTEYPDHPDRFDFWPQVLCREALTGTRCYWEVEWGGNSGRIGVTYKGLTRKGVGEECRLGCNVKSWSLFCSNSQYFAHHNDRQTVICSHYSPRIGVYLNWPAGTLSFYSVSHTMTLLYSFKTSFTELLYPGFGLGPDSSVMICHL